jgi:hypothetical protein
MSGFARGAVFLVSRDSLTPESGLVSVSPLVSVRH